jgi:hypothetical protein
MPTRPDADGNSDSFHAHSPPPLLPNGAAACFLKRLATVLIVYKNVNTVRRLREGHVLFHRVGNLRKRAPFHRWIQCLGE